MKIAVVEEPAGEVMLGLPQAIAADQLPDELPDELHDYAVGGARIDCRLASGTAADGFRACTCQRSIADRSAGGNLRLTLLRTPNGWPSP